MKINVRVIPRARVCKITTEENGDIRVYTNVPPADGKANAAVIAALASYLDVPKSRIVLIRGATSRDKVFMIQD